MTTTITWYGHGCWFIESHGHRILIDPFLSDSPTAPIGPDEVEADYLLVSHGHFDHFGDTVDIARRTGAQVVGIVELCWWLNHKGIENTLAMNLGGTAGLPFGRVQLTPALHSSTMPDGKPGGEPASFLIFLPEGNLYFGCDTGLFSDMSLIGRHGIEFAFLPIGDLFTMGPDDALEAVKFLRPKQVVPCHFGTWPPIEQDPEAWAKRVRTETEAEPLLMKPGETISLG